MRIQRRVVEEIVSHARGEAPLECCGLLIGVADRVDESYPVRNIRQSRTSFEVDPAGHFAAIRRARASRRAVIGAYHSHPASPPIPSDTDVREAYDPDLLHVIVSLAGEEPAMRAYRIANGVAEPLGLVVAD